MSGFNPDKFLAGEATVDPVINAPASTGDRGIPAQVAPAEAEFNPDEFLANEYQAQYGGPAQAATAFAEAAGRGFASQPIATAAEIASGVPKQDIMFRQKANPWVSFFGELAGFGAGAFTGTGEARALTALGEGASAAFGAGKIGAPIIKSLVDGLALTGGEEASQYLLDNPDQTAGSVVAHVGLGTILSGGIGTVSGLWSAAKSDGVNAVLNFIKSDSEAVGASLAPKPGDPKVNDIMKTAISVALGPTPQEIDARVANLAAMREAPEFQTVYDHVLDHLESVGDDVAKQKGLLEQATKEFEQNGYELKVANQAAKVALKDAQVEVIQDLNKNALSKAPAIANAVEILRSQVVDESQKAYEVLEKSRKTISLKPLFNAAKELQDKVFAEGSPLALQQAEALGKYVDTLGAQYGDKVSAENAKSIIKGLDNLSKYNFNATQFESGLSPIYKRLRYALDTELKEKIPAYAAAMKPVAQKAALLSNLSRYGTTEDAVKAVNTLKNKTNFINDMPFLRDLQEKVGIKFAEDLDRYASPALREMRIAKIPEYAEAERLARAVEFYKNPETRQALEHTIMTNPDWLQAMRAKEAVRGLTETNLQGKLNAAMNNKNISARSLVSKLPGLEGMSIPEVLDLIALRQAFERTNLNGSRNVTLFGGTGATIGAGLGGMIAGPHGAAMGAGLGGSLGSGLGSVIDKKGPAIAGKLLDKYVESFGPLPEKAGISKKVTRAVLQKVLGSEAPANAEAFKAASHYVEAAMKGRQDAKNAAKAVFIKGATVLPKYLIPTKEKIRDLDDKLKEVGTNEEAHFAFGGEVGHYLPDEAMGVTQIGTQAVNFLNSLRPEPVKLSPLDPELPPTPVEKLKFDRILEVAEQPLMVFHHLKEGTLLPDHVDTVKNIYPGFYDQMNQDLTNAMVDHLEGDNSIPYYLKNGIGTVLGQAMDSTFNQATMIEIIKGNAGATSEVDQAARGPSKVPASALTHIEKANKQYLTSTQAGEMNNQKV